MRKIPSKLLLTLLILFLLIGVFCISRLYRAPVPIHSQQSHAAGFRVMLDGPVLIS